MVASVSALLFTPLAGLLLAAAPHLAAASCFHTSRLTPRAAGDYSYHGVTGPYNWHGLGSENRLCARGKNQAPINIFPGGHGITTLTSATQKPVPSYEAGISVPMKNTGKTIEVAARGTLKFDGADWKLLQFHFHTPSENHFRDEHQPMEAHFVHERVGTVPSGGAKFLVLAFWLSFTTGGSSGAEPFDGVLNKAQTIAGAGASTTTDPLNFDALKQHVANNVVYKYAGSLTTPPCGEGVTWTVVGEPMALSVAAYNKGKATMKFNSRPTQNDPGKDNLIGIASKNYCGVQLCIG